MAESLALCLTGAPLLRVGARDCALDGLAAVLAARLALDGPQPRAALAALLWPDADPARARANLRQRLLRLKQQVGVDWIVGDVVLSLGPAVQLEPLDAPQAGELLQGLRLPAELEQASQWLDSARNTLRHRRLQLLATRAAAAEAEQRWADAEQAVQDQLALDPHAEGLHRALIRLHYLAGDGARARAAHAHLVRLLQREYGAAPGAETQALMQLVERAEPAPSQRPALQAWATALGRPPRLVGRDADLLALRQVVDQGGALLLLGEAGMGKSRLLAEALGGGAHTITVKAQAGDAGVPYATLARLLRRLIQPRSVPAGATALARLLPEVGPVLPLPADGDRLLLQGAVGQVVAGAGLQAVAVDDLHFADDASVDMLTTLVAQDVPGRLAWIFTQRPGEGSAAASALRDTLEEAQQLTTRTLLPLDAAQMAELVRSLHLPELDADTLGPRLVQHTGGNPLFALETLKQMLLPQQRGTALPQPGSVGALIDRRLRQLNEGALALARVAAIAGPDFGPALAEDVLGRKAIDLADAWAELEAAQVIRDNAFAHDLVLEATLRSMPRTIVGHLHGAVAQHLQQQGGEAARIATHWQRAGRDHAALPWLVQAAEQARAGLRRREEAAFAEAAATIAASLGPSAPVSAYELWLQVYLARDVTDGGRAALVALEQALMQARDERDRLHVLVLRADTHAKLTELALSIAAGREALALAERIGDDEMTVDVMTILATSLSMEGRIDEAAALMARLWPAVERLDAPKPAHFSERAVVLDNAGRPLEARHFHRQAMALAREQRLWSELVINSANFAVSLMDTGEQVEALGVLEAAEQLRSSHDGLDSANVVCFGHLAMACRDLGLYSRALQHSQRMVAIDAEQRPARLPFSRLNRGWIWAAIGQWSRAVGDAATPAQREHLPDWVWARSQHLRWRVAAARTQPGRAGMDEALAAARDGGLRTVHDSIALDLALHTGDAAAAEALAQAAERDGFHGIRWAATWAAAALMLQSGDAAAARRLAEACLLKPAGQTALDRADGVWWHGLWRVWRALGERDRAEAARAEGVAWIHRTLQRELPAEFHAAFRDAVPAHRDLLAG